MTRGPYRLQLDPYMHLQLHKSYSNETEESSNLLQMECDMVDKAAI
jgi:hypothetical protein